MRGLAEQAGVNYFGLGEHHRDDMPVSARDVVLAFERSLAAESTILVKFWMHIADEEQLRRFQRREKDPLRRWKITDEDWRNRSHGHPRGAVDPRGGGVEALRA